MRTRNQRRVNPLADSGLLDGLLLIDKHAGPTSHDVVNNIRKKFLLPKVGHGGTLDPNATGLLVILLGKGTKISNRLMGSDKTYIGVARLGCVTNTQDCQGEVLEQQPWEHIQQAQAEERLAEFRGDIFQTPPMVSAVKVKGVPLYKMARKGREVERQPRLVHIYRFVITAWQPPCFNFEVECTKGVYVRTLVHDLGQQLGCGAVLDELRRTTVGPFALGDAATVDQVMSWTTEQLCAKIVPLQGAVRMLSGT